MKIACQSCGAKYTIADEKVSGKTVKIKCKKCGATVVVDGHAQHMEGHDVGAAQGHAGGGEEWTVSVADDDQRSLTTAGIAEAYQQGIITGDTFVWRDGMAEWLSLSQVPELVAACGGGAHAPAAAIADPATHALDAGGGGYGGATPFGGAAPFGGGAGYGAAAAAAPAAAAAVRKQGRGGVDLFGGGGGAGPAAAEAAPAAASSAHIGERNENSVLFSLSALTAAETAAKKGSAPKPARANLDLAGGGGGGAKSSIDDIMNLGSGSIAGSSLAPPPINAPFIEPPPPPAPVASMHPPASMGGPAMGAGPGMHMGAGAMPMPYEQQQPKKAPVGLIVGGILGVLVLAGGAFMLGRGGDDEAKKDAVAANDTTKKQGAEEPSKKEPAADDRPAEPAPEAAKADEPKADDAAATADAKADPAGAATTGKTAPTTPPTTGGAAPPSTGTKKEEPKTEEPKKEEPKKEEPAASATGSFDRGAAQAALGSAAGGAKGCKKDGGPTGSTKVQVTFAPSGRVTTVNVGPPFAGTPVGSCIAGAFKGLSVPAFSGSPVTVSKTVSIK